MLLDTWKILGILRPIHIVWKFTFEEPLKSKFINISLYMRREYIIYEFFWAVLYNQVGLVNSIKLLWRRIKINAVYWKARKSWSVYTLRVEIFLIHRANKESAFLTACSSATSSFFMYYFPFSRYFTDLHRKSATKRDLRGFFERIQCVYIGNFNRAKDSYL